MANTKTSNTIKIATYFLDVGQGDCSFVICPKGDEAVMVDCADAFVASRFVKDFDIHYLPVVVISHLDQDHIGGMLDFLKNFLAHGGAVGNVYVNTDRSQITENALDLLENLWRWENEKRLSLGASSRDGSEPKRLYGGKNWRIELVLPFHGRILKMHSTRSGEPNSFSAVVRVVCGSQALLLGADAPLDSWKNLEPHLFPARVVRSPHHGGNLGTARTLTATDLYHRISAELCVHSVGTRNGHSHPLPAHATASRRGGGCRVLCTQLTRRCDGAPVTHREQALQNASGVVYPYRHRIAPGDPNHDRPKHEVPCAGSTLVILDSNGDIEVEPAREGWHDHFVSMMGTPLCRPS